MYLVDWGVVRTVPFRSQVTFGCGVPPVVKVNIIGPPGEMRLTSSGSWLKKGSTLKVRRKSEGGGGSRVGKEDKVYSMCGITCAVMILYPITTTTEIFVHIRTCLHTYSSFYSLVNKAHIHYYYRCTINTKLRLCMVRLCMLSQPLHLQQWLCTLWSR